MSPAGRRLGRSRSPGHDLTHPGRTKGPVVGWRDAGQRLGRYRGRVLPAFAVSYPNLDALIPEQRVELKVMPCEALQLLHESDPTASMTLRTRRACNTRAMQTKARAVAHSVWLIFYCRLWRRILALASKGKRRNSCG